MMHSYGAVVGCEAMKGIKVDEAASVMESGGALKVGRVVNLAFIAGCLFPEGKATWDINRAEEALPGFVCKVRLAFRA